MNDFLHIDLPFDDDEIKTIEEALGIKFQKVYAQTISANEVEVCPTHVNGELHYMELKFTK